MIPDTTRKGSSVLAIEWIERVHATDKKIIDRQYSHRLIPELREFIDVGGLTVKEGKVPSEVVITNGKGKTVKLFLWEPTRIEIKSN